MIQESLSSCSSDSYSECAGAFFKILSGSCHTCSELFGSHCLVTLIVYECELFRQNHSPATSNHSELLLQSYNCTIREHMSSKKIRFCFTAHKILQLSDYRFAPKTLYISLRFLSFGFSTVPLICRLKLKSSLIIWPYSLPESSADCSTKNSAGDKQLKGRPHAVKQLTDQNAPKCVCLCDRGIRSFPPFVWFEDN